MWTRQGVRAAGFCGRRWISSGVASTRSPRDFSCVATKFGWFLVPKKVHVPRWTSVEVEKTIQDKCSDWTDDDRSVARMQQVVDEWSAGLKPLAIPKPDRVSPSQIRQLEEEALYKLQLREDVLDAAPVAPVARKRKHVSKRGSTINYRHAWNYFFSISFSKLKKEGSTKKELTELVRNAWNELSADEKEKYRKEYENLIASGYDVYRSKIVTIEEKLALKKPKS